VSRVASWPALGASTSRLQSTKSAKGKTRSGKILRGTMRQIADNASYKMPAIVDDPAILSEITAVLRGRSTNQRSR
jgi:hypothetical protein